ncbi:MAG: tetratricopeptide repeat protein [Bacillota bacterium]
MMVRAKTKRRLFILLTVVLVVTLALTAAVLVRKRQINNRYAVMRETGMAAYKAGDYEGTLNSLASYIKRYPQDADALYALAESRRQVETPDGNYLPIAAQLYRRFLELRPDRTDARRELTLLYSAMGYHSETIESARIVLEKQPNDVPILSAQARAYAIMRNAKDALKVAEHAVKIEPLNLMMHALVLECYRELDRKADILPYAQAFLESHPADARAEALMGAACMVAGDLTAGQQQKLSSFVAAKYPNAKLENTTALAAATFFIRQAARRPMNEPEFVRIIVNQLEQLRLPLESTAVLERALDAKDNPQRDDVQLRRLLIRRLFELGQYADIEKRLANVKLDASGADLEMLALKGIALVRLNRQPESSAIADALAAVANDRVAHAWSEILKQVFIANNNDNPKLLEILAAALEVQKANPYFHFFRGEAYAAIGERDAAISSFKKAAASSPLWPLPFLRLSQLLLEDGKPADAVAAARGASELFPSPATYSNWARVWASTISPAKIHEERDLANLVAYVQRVQPGEEQTLPLHVLILTKTGQRSAAEKAIRATLESKTPPRDSLLLRLAAVSRESQLGLENACYELAEKLYGLTPELAFTQAMAMYRDGKHAEAEGLLNDARQKHAQDLAWRILWARYLEQTGDNRAAAEWIALADDPSLKANLSVQRMALAARSVQSNHEFLNRAIDRIRTLTGEHAIYWRVARAALLSQANASNDDLSKAAKLLNEVIAADPEYVEARSMLASVYDRMRNIPAAIEQITAALKIKPDAPELLLELARLYQSVPDYPRAREQMDRLHPDRLNPTHRQQLASLFAQQGEWARAASLIDGDSEATTRPSDNLLRAAIYSRQNQLDKAEKIYRQMLQQPTPRAIVAAATFFASTGRKAEAEKILQNLKDLNLAPGMYELAWADYYASYGTSEQAIEQYRNTLKLIPAQANTWHALMAQYTRAGRVTDALAACEEALKALPGDKSLERFRSSAAALQTLAADNAAFPLMAIAAQGSADSDVALEALSILADVVKSQQSLPTAIPKLRPLADRTPSLVPLQSLLARLYLATHRVSDAVTIAQRGMQFAPASPEMAQTAAQMYTAAKNWPQALAAANRWRQLTPQQPLPADLFIAGIHLQSGSIQSAAQQIAPYLEAAKAKPDEYMPVLITQARLLVAKGDITKAADLLWPLASQSAPWRRAWLELALSIPAKPQVTASWLDRVSSTIPETDAASRMALAQAWQMLANASGSSEYLDKARLLLTQLEAGTANPADAAFAMGLLHEQENKLDEAEKAYRRALKLQPDSPAAQNNLAMVILQRKGNLSEAAGLVSKAIEARPHVPAFYDTLAQINMGTKDYDNAIRNLKKAIAIEQWEPKWQLTLAEVYDQAGQLDEAKRKLQEIASLLPDPSRLSPEFQARLKKLSDKVTKGSASSSPQ